MTGSRVVSVLSVTALPTVISVGVVADAGVSGLWEAINEITVKEALMFLGMLSAIISAIFTAGWKLKNLLDEPSKQMKDLMSNHFAEENIVHECIQTSVGKVDRHLDDLKVQLAAASLEHVEFKAGTTARLEVVFEHLDPPVPHEKVVAKERQVRKEMGISHGQPEEKD
jgi:hypothetical protein